MSRVSKLTIIHHRFVDHKLQAQKVEVEGVRIGALWVAHRNLEHPRNWDLYHVPSGYYCARIQVSLTSARSWARYFSRFPGIDWSSREPLSDATKEARENLHQPYRLAMGGKPVP